MAPEQIREAIDIGNFRLPSVLRDLLYDHALEAFSTEDPDPVQQELINAVEFWQCA